METEYKRLFFGFEIDAPWPDVFPVGHLLEEKNRHLTLAFLGNSDFSKLEEHLDQLPLPNFKVGFAAKFDQCLFLPSKHPRCVSYHVKWLEDEKSFLDYYGILLKWLDSIGFPADSRHDFNPHVTICRSPFKKEEWEKFFHSIPLITKGLHLYESKGNLIYTPIKTIPILPPFEEIEHTADMAFSIYGNSLKTLFRHAQVALSFAFPPLLEFMIEPKEFEKLHDVIIALNDLVSDADHKIGCPFKAVSFHGNVEEHEQYNKWDMIIDV